MTCVSVCLSGSILEEGQPGRLVPPDVVGAQQHAAGAHEQQEAGVDPVPRGESRPRLVRPVDPDADDLAGGAHRDVQRNGQARGRRAPQVGRQPAEEGRDARKRARGRHNQTAVALLRGKKNQPSWCGPGEDEWERCLRRSGGGEARRWR